jgi:predicted PhzF superfamily epimerase YddE/YHI9
MGRRNEIHIEIDGDAESIRGVRVGGECASVGRGTIEIAD